MELTQQELAIFQSLKNANFETLWGMAISNVVTKENPDTNSVRNLIWNLRSQTIDCKEVMASVIGEPACIQLLNLEYGKA